MLSPLSFLRDGFIALKRNFLIMLTAFSAFFSVFSFVLLISAVSEAALITSVLSQPDISISLFSEIAFLPSSVLSVIADFILASPVFISVERMAFMCIKGIKPRMSELFWGFESARIWRIAVLRTSLLFVMLVLGCGVSVFAAFIHDFFSWPIGVFLEYVFYGVGVCIAVSVFTLFISVDFVFAYEMEYSLKKAVILVIRGREGRMLFSTLLPFTAVFFSLVEIGELFLLSALITPLFVMCWASVFDRVFFNLRAVKASLRNV